MVEFRLFGSIELRDGHGGELTRVLSQPKRLALLAYLAAAVPRGFHRRDKIVALFWPEMDHEHARAALRRSLHFLRGFLGEGVILRRGDEEVGLNWEKVWCDLNAFEEAMGRGEEEEAIRLYRGDLLSGFFLPGSPGFERWLEEERMNKREAAATALWTSAHRCVETGRVTDGERLGQKALSLVCSDEKEVQRFMTALTEVGDRAAAIQFYERFSEGIRRALDLEPSAHSKILARKLRAEQEEQGDGVDEVPTPGTRKSV